MLPWKGPREVVAGQLLQHFEKNNLQEAFQSAYRIWHSTETALLQVKSDIDIALDEGCGMLLVILDLSAAFNTIDDTILLKRLSSMGVNNLALKWISSYLSGRGQSIVILSERSVPTPLDVGVPQASILGPLLFITYIQPLGAILRKHGVMFHGYADDTQILCQV